MNSFYIEDGRLSREDARHAERVLRLRPGDQIVALDGFGGHFLAELLEGGGVKILKSFPDNEPTISLTVYQGIPKADKLEFLAQKLTELGVKRLVPVKMERSVKKLDRVDRLLKIAREAAKQCGRACPVELSAPMDWAQAAKDMHKRSTMAVPWEEASEGRLSDLTKSTDIGLLIGPEGGITPREIEESGGNIVTLGPHILRTETAAVAASAIIMEIMGEL